MNQITDQLLLTLIGVQNKDVLYLLNNRDKHNADSEMHKHFQDLVQSETGQTIALYQLYKFARGEINEEQLKDAFYNSKTVVQQKPQVQVKDQSASARGTVSVSRHYNEDGSVTETRTVTQPACPDKK